jgi:hypothetical protein
MCEVPVSRPYPPPQRIPLDSADALQIEKDGVAAGLVRLIHGRQPLLLLLLLMMMMMMMMMMMTRAAHVACRWPDRAGRLRPFSSTRHHGWAR